MNGIMCFLVVLWVAACGGGGGGGATGDDGGAGGDGAPSDGTNPGSDAQTNADAGTDGSTLAASNDHCAAAIPIDLGTMHKDLSATTLGATADLTAPCGAAGLPDVFFTFTTTRRELVYADTFGASSNTTLYFASSCTTAVAGPTTSGDAVCSNGACTTGQSQVAALLLPGTHYLVFAGNGAATIHFQHVQVGSGTVSYLEQGMTTPTGTTTGTGSLNKCQAAGAENAYWWMTCPSDAGGLFTASTCDDAAFDTVLSMQRPGAEDVACNDDGCGGSAQSSVSASIPAGAALYVVAVDALAQSSKGLYTLTASRP
jgi:hypothetical protein